MRPRPSPAPSPPAFVARVAAFALGLASFSAASTAHAQIAPEVNVRTFRPSTDPRAQLFSESPMTPGSLEPSFAAWAAYEQGTVTLTRNDGSTAAKPVQNALILDLTANMGVGRRFAFGVGLPVYLWQGGSDNLPASASSRPTVSPSGIGDLNANVKWNWLENELGGFGVAALAHLTLPTGREPSFLNERGFTAGGRLLVDYSLLIAGAQASVGYIARSKQSAWPADGDPTLASTRFGDSVPFSFALWFRPKLIKMDDADRQRWELGLRGSLPAGPVGPFGLGEAGSSNLSPLMLGVSDRIEIGKHRDVFFVGGAEVGLTTAWGTPNVRLVAMIGYAMRSHDRDHDGIPDDVDECPDVPEDKDGYLDSDGCPDIDDDDDGIVDKYDACPRVRGVKNANPRMNGCPPRDSDHDGIPDDLDACPRISGSKNTDRECNGCPINDRDGDGIEDGLDRCPDQPEDKDGFEDDDGCPEPGSPADRDGDGVLDTVDACPAVLGDPRWNGCKPGTGMPTGDDDGDGIPNATDACPKERETYNGVADDDGCPDAGGMPLVRIDENKGEVALRRPIAFERDDVAKRSLPDVRALAVVLLDHPTWTIGVGSSPLPADPLGQAALRRSFAVSTLLGQLVPRDTASMTVGADALPASQRGRNGSVGFLLLQPKAAP